MILDDDSLTRVNNDTNGNPRYVIHFLNLNTTAEKNRTAVNYSTTELYELAVKRGRQLGGKRFHNKQYGGGIVFQSYNTGNLLERIDDMMLDLNDEDELEGSVAA